MIVLAWCVWILVGAGEDPGGQAVDALFGALLAGATGPSVASLLAWAAWAPIALGVDWLGIASLFLGQRAPEESPPPRWVPAWCLMAAAPLLGGHPEAAPALGLLVPLGAVGLADHLLRIEQDDQARRRARILAGSQLLLGLLALLVLRTTDPVRPWAEHARQALEPGDLVLSADPDHRFWLLHRFLLEAPDLDDPQLPALLERAASDGGRVVLDDPLPDRAPTPARAVRLSGLGG